ncbi:tetratricopeptide repeat protein [Pseudooceanicola marinus]|uniref:tetratricopeptide repeat protein n=1 Tax=Pseudooceanicola marinus TaxID=396013 RepID=UPI001CD5A9F2|nr:tetratricopeptide repeat protein [Pseudooceanicola marinus]MCA1334997.1 tetratricopeptide repeat protein [Pseudooceanicola marinus]
MSSFDDLPKRDRNHALEEEAEAAFQALISHSEDFVFQGSDRKDYGTDCQIEVVLNGQATNVRVHVQLKGTERALNADGSFSIPVDRANLNYLVAQPYSFYVGYHSPSKSLRVSFVDAVLRRYEHSGKDWTDQQSLTILFTDELTVDRLSRLASLALSGSRIARDRRIAQTTATIEAMPVVVREAKPELHVPEDPDLARQLAKRLYESGADRVLSAAFEQFLSVLGADHDAMGFCYMAEINLGMGYQSPDVERIEAALTHFRSRLDTGRFQVGSLYYTIGNALSALDQEQEAKASYIAALEDSDFSSSSEMAAQCYKNLGTSFERLGDEDIAAEHYLEALRLNPNLPEAHNALAHYHHRNGRYEEALSYFDRVVFTDRKLGRTSAISGWRINVLFSLDDTRAAFREINGLLSNADSEPWIWPWCARQVAAFGRTSVESALPALAFWDRCIETHPQLGRARAERLLTSFYLRAKGHDIGEYSEFRSVFDKHIAIVDAEDAALPWDRLGHWAQDEGNWEGAELCFRKAYEMAGGHYGYCLGTALNFLGRFEESRPILLEQAEHLQPDAMSWFQLGLANSNTGRTSEAIAAYEKAIELDPEYDIAMFNLGGVLWNEGEIVAAEDVWLRAVEKFPNHELVEEVLAILELTC